MVKYRIDGVLQEAMAPIAREHHTTILSRIKIMSELDIAERQSAAGRALPGALQGQADRFPRVALCPRCMAKMPCCACSTRSR